ncbi:MAG: HAMP domain-containing histidine kinase [Deltaproteobacteria bacterium]|nr:MAG: HAMP domain-containing histidine kinase [Deltaproteobacteria bacterium]
MPSPELSQTSTLVLPSETEQTTRKGAVARWRDRLLWGLRAKTVVTFLIPALLTVGLFGWYVRFRFKEGLDSELGQRLINVGKSARPLLSPQVIGTFGPGDQTLRSYRNMQRKLRQLLKETGARRIYIFDEHRKSLLDTQKVDVGTKYVSLSFEDSELKAAFQGKSQAGVLFQDKKGRQYKTGFTPLFEGQDVIAVIAVEGSARYFKRIQIMQRELLVFGVLSLALVVFAGLLFAGWLVSPVKKLVGAARNIGEGNLTEEVPTLGRDEIGFLAETMEEMRQNILARDRHLQMMLSGIAHEVRNPLGGMELFSGILKEELADDPDKLSHINRIQRELRYLGDVVNSFLDYARPTTIHIAPHDWHEFLIEITMLMSSNAAEKGVELKMIKLKGETEVFFDRGRMHQVVINLVQNAIQASPTDSTIQLESRWEEGGLLFTLLDEGPGIPEEKLEQVFEPFFTTKEKGTGLGLPLAKKFVESQDGRIAIVCPPEGGTLVSIWLPQRGAESRSGVPEEKSSDW